MKKTQKRTRTILMAIVGVAIIAGMYVIFFMKFNPLAAFTDSVATSVAKGQRLSVDGHNSFDDNVYEEFRQLSEDDAQQLLKTNHIYKACEGKWICTKSWTAWPQLQLSDPTPGPAYPNADTFMAQATTVCNVHHIKSEKGYYISETQALCIDTITKKILIWNYRH